MTLTECAIQIVFNINLNRATGGNKDYTAALTIMLSALQLTSRISPHFTDALPRFPIYPIVLIGLMHDNIHLFSRIGR